MISCEIWELLKILFLQDTSERTFNAIQIFHEPLLNNRSDVLVKNDPTIDISLKKSSWNFKISHEDSLQYGVWRIDAFFATFEILREYVLQNISFLQNVAVL